MKLFNNAKGTPHRGARERYRREGRGHIARNAEGREKDRGRRERKRKGNRKRNYTSSHMF